MTGEDILIGMIQEVNRETLEELNLVLTVSDIGFGDPYPGEWLNGANTKVGATARGQRLEGTYTYHYDRLDIQAAFATIGVDEVIAEVNGEVTPNKVLNTLKYKHNLWLPLDELEDFTYVDGKMTFVIKEGSYVWLGSLVVTVEQGIPTIGALFPVNVLNGLLLDGEDPLPGTGIYQP